MTVFRKSVHSLAGKLIIAVGILMTAGSLLFGYLFLRFEEQVMLKNLIDYAASTADFVNRGINYGMLTGRHDTIQQTIEVLGVGENRLVRVYNKSGMAVYASNRDDLGKQLLGPEEFKRTAQSPRSIDYVTKDGEKLLLYRMPVYNEPRCSTAACHFHRSAETVLGIVEAGVSTRPMQKLIFRNRVMTVALGGAFFFVIAVCLGIIFYKFVSKPVALLETGMRRIAAGELGEPIKIDSKDEMGLLAWTFNSMARDLKSYRQQMEDFTHTLQEEVRKKTEEIMEAQEELINAEKLASLGRMSAGVAHELNSPLTGIVTFSHLVKGRIPAGDQQTHEDLQIIIDQASRCSRIIKGLLGFSRRTGFEMIEIHVNGLIEGAVSMIRNQARFHNIHFDIRLAPSLPAVLGDPNQLQQVFLNLLINAADAMNEKGQMLIATRPCAEARDFIELEFTDSGPGIPEANLGKIFEPFFTTKPVGTGTGLGLSVSYGIIKKHGGDISVKSQPGKGASFFIKLPVNKKGYG